MTCRVLVVTPDGLTTQARALLDSASSTSFVSERLVQRLRLPRRSQLAHIAGIGGVSHRTLSQSVVHFAITHSAARGKTFNIQAIVLPRVTSELPLRPVIFDTCLVSNWPILTLGSLDTSTFCWEWTCLVACFFMAGGLELLDLLLHSKPVLDRSWPVLSQMVSQKNTCHTTHHFTLGTTSCEPSGR